MVVMKEKYQNLFDERMLVAEGKTEAAKKASVRVDPEVSGLRKNLLEQETLVSLLARKCDTLSSSFAVISREIARRGQNPFEPK